MTRRPKSTAVLSLAKFSVVVLLLAGAYLYTLSRPASTSAEKLTFEIKKGKA